MTEIRPPRPRRVLYWVTFTCILLCSAILICYRIDEPLWESGHHGFHMAEYPHNARNYLRFGYLTTRLGLVQNYGNREPAGRFSYRVDHPMLLTVLISYACRIFRAHEWSARLFPVILSLGTSVATFLLALHMSGNRWNAMAALVFCGLSPMITYYGRLPAPHNASLFFSLVFFYLYWRWFVTERSGYLITAFVMLTAGAFADWIAYFAVAPILVHYLVFSGKQWKWSVTIALVLSPFLLFASYVLYVYWLVGVGSLQALWGTLLARTGSSVGLTAPLTVAGVWEVSYRRSVYWLTTPVLVLFLGWFIRFCRMLVSRKVSASQGLVFALLVFGSSFSLVFTNLAMVHDFVMFYQLAPVFAVASASALTWIVARYSQRATILITTAIVMVFSLFAKQSLGAFCTEHSKDVPHTEVYYVGKALAKVVSDTGSYIDAVEFPHHLALRMRATADRSFRSVETLDDFVRLEDNPTYEAIIVDNSDGTEAELREYLTERYPRTDVSGYSIFELDQDGSDTVVGNPHIENPYRITFQDQIEFLGYDIDRVVYQKDEQIEWVERYLTQYAELLPQNRTIFRVVNYWRKITDEPIDYTLRTQFDAHNGQLFRLEQEYGGLDDLYPTVYWPTNQIIREEFEIVVPAEHPSLNYGMWVSVERDARWYLFPEASQVADATNRVRVGQVYVRATAAEVSPQSISYNVDYPVAVRLDKGLSLIGLGLSQDAVYPGDLLVVTLTWRARTEVGQDYKVFVHVMDPEGRLVAQHDGKPDHWRQPTPQWEPGMPIQDAHPMVIPPDVPPGTYHVRVGMYQEGTMERLSVLSASGASASDVVQVGTVEVLHLDE
jgi:hypothetical protein